ncbi:hypothetical protein PTSG_09613 [Salpingoeca rosetta]|uniref:Uncharacterized protein n=1 Tax=Salpingoeca rosetta (strain ATCC 50818 / BSB-021) TaxID=946362 RepID=F2ULI1_SALR5|nr:uncharacterized protein PTSG_09613 [Salpingoeca rosetta]EGD77980.1 hypothetical protein PTSG_09613 [Salpingoeca rosetta]|eukprot:XP_004990042.1 hypothetical protein PTSG_09613 [Salpingoeca rosetta]
MMVGARCLRRVAYCLLCAALCLVGLAVLLAVLSPYDTEVVVDVLLGRDLREGKGVLRQVEKRRRAEESLRELHERRDRQQREIASVLSARALPRCSSVLQQDTGLLHITGNASLVDKALVSQLTQQPHEYCLYQCGPRRCCSDAYRRLPSPAAAAPSWLEVAVDAIDGAALSELDVTLVTQGTLDRVHVVEMLCRAWRGPKVVVFAVREAGTEHPQLRTLQSTCHNAKIVAVPITESSDFYTSRFRASDPAAPPVIPINTLRNLAVDLAPTNFIFTCDMDFLPSASLYDSLVTRYLPLLAAIDRPALVVPHWELLRCGGSAPPPVPTTFQQLDKMAMAGLARPFHCDPKLIVPAATELATPSSSCMEGRAVWWRGIETTQYYRWLRESRAHIQGFYRIATGGPMKDIFYEPFVVVKRKDGVSGANLPRYPEHYVGRYKNKISFITRLRAHRFQFFTLRGEFLVHFPHDTSKRSKPYMQEHLQAMRALDELDRSDLNDEVWTVGPQPPLQPSPPDDGVHCIDD